MRPDAMRSFTPYRLGRMECDAWVAYYRREWGRFLSASIGMVREGFGMDPARTVCGAALVLRANQQWAPYPHNDAAGAFETMRRFYRLVKDATHERFDVTEAATLELAWWKAHREAQRAEGAPVELVDALTALSAYVYGVEANTVRPAAQLRADAMHVSDRWVADGCRLSSPLLVEELTLLVRSYDALLGAVAPR